MRKSILKNIPVKIEHIKSLITTEYINIESKNLFIIALSFYINNSISFVDSFLLTKAKEENAELFTFDQKLRKLF